MIKSNIRKCSCSIKSGSNVLCYTGGRQWRTLTRMNLLLLLIAVSVTAAVADNPADRYHQSPTAAARAPDAAASFKDVVSNDVSTGSLRTSSILPVPAATAAKSSNVLAVGNQQHRFGKPSSITAAAAGSKKQQQQQQTAAELSSLQQVPELQIGCEDGFIRADHHHRRLGTGMKKKWDRKRNRSTRNKRTADPVEGERKRRDYPIVMGAFYSPLGYYQWTSKSVVQTPPQAAYSAWQPSLQQLARPYFIPMWGSAGRNPVYFPPQPLNPPFPLDNPRTSYLPAMPYLPPYPPRREDGTTTTTTTLKPIWEDPDYDGDMGDDGDDVIVDPGDTVVDNRFQGPVWGSSNSESSSDDNTVNRVPTRKPKVSGTTTQVPSILHGTSSGAPNRNDNAFNNNVPPLSNSISNSNPMRPNQISGGNTQFTRPPLRTTTTTTPRPTTASNSKRPTRCVWAIVSCCTASSGQVNFDCFEELGCQGPFWDTNPCDSEVARAAIANALKFYG